MTIRHAPLLLVCATCAFAADSKPTPADARKFIDDVEQKLLLLNVDAGRADWIRSTYIIDDSEILAAKMDEMREAIAFHVEGMQRNGERVPEPHTYSHYVEIPVGD